jgi:hypothetical protein
MKKVYHFSATVPGFNNDNNRGLFFSNLKKAYACYLQWCRPGLPLMDNRSLSYSTVAPIVALSNKFQQDFKDLDGQPCYIKIQLEIVL